jgi:hypothetical protein
VPRPQDAIPAQVEALGSDGIGGRSEAPPQLQQIGEGVVPRLAEALAGPDAEVRVKESVLGTVGDPGVGPKPGGGVGRAIAPRIGHFRNRKVAVNSKRISATIAISRISMRRSLIPWWASE